MTTTATDLTNYQLISLSDAQDMLGISTTLIYELMNEHKLPYVLVSGRRKISLADLKAYIDRNRKSGRMFPDGVPARPASAAAGIVAEARL